MRLDRNPLLRLLILALAATAVFVIVSQGGHQGQPVAGFLLRGFFGLIITGVAVFHLFLGHRESVWGSNRRILVVFFFVLAQLLLVRSAVVIADESIDRIALFVPFGLAPMALCVLLGQRLGIFATIYGAFLSVLMLDAGSGAMFMVLSLACGGVAIASTLRVRRRSQLIQAGLYVGITHLALVWALGISRPDPSMFQWSELAQIDWVGLMRQSFTVFGVELAAAIVISGLLPVLEWMADVTTDISWIELSDLNHPLLKRMTMEAPGTYHHSLVVSTLAEAAAEAVGANDTMVRVCSYFHDIGKLEDPVFFIENQGGGANPHDALTPQMSALKIIAHVKNGVTLARARKLNRRIISAIREHHGDSRVEFFYRRAVDLREAHLDEVARGLRAEEDVIKVDEEDFRYPGPRPTTRECAIISLADAVESASRTLSNPSLAEIRALIDRLIDMRLRDGQLAEAPLTMRDLTRIRESFANTIKNVLHGRVPYPAERVEFEGALPGAAAAEGAGPSKSIAANAKIGESAASASGSGEERTDKGKNEEADKKKGDQPANETVTKE